jgi:OFA family oxalate/formate antiporter-like MFS transporter
MSAQAATMSSLRSRGWIVTLAGLGINLALGVLYTWSVISKAIPDNWEWSETARSLPYSIAVLLFSLMMVPGGRIQDRFGPRTAATLGGILVGLGFIVSSLTTSPVGWMIGFGILLGSGIGFAYSAPIPAAVKWFPPQQTGMISGIVVSGFGLASLYAAPLTQALIESLGISGTVLALGIAFLAIIVGLAQLLIVPPMEYRAQLASQGSLQTSAGGRATLSPELAPGEVLKSLSFFMMWFMYACGAGAGLMIISKLAAIGELQAGLKLGFVLVATLALGNGLGRVVTGILSDYIGRRQTLLGCFIFQAILIWLLSTINKDSFLAHPVIMCIISAFIGANFGANLALFPAAAKDYYGLKHFGANYGMLFTAYGVGGFSLALAAGGLYDIYKSFTPAYLLAGGLLIAAAVCTLLLPKPQKIESGP